MARTSRVEIPITAKDNATRQIQRVKSQLMGLASTAKTVMSGLSGLGGVAGVAGITMLARSAISAGSAITDMATATQTGIEELQALTFAAREAGASNEQMANLLVRAQKSANDAARGLSTAKDAFALLGINVDKFINLAPERKLEVLGRAIVKADGDTRAYGAALDLLGTRNAPKLMEVLQRLGTEGFDTISEKARNANQVMSVETAQALDSASDQIENFKNAFIIEIGESIAGWGKLIDFIKNKTASLSDQIEIPTLPSNIDQTILGLSSEQERIDLIDDLMKKLTDLQALQESHAAANYRLFDLEQLISIRESKKEIQEYLDMLKNTQVIISGNQQSNAILDETNGILQKMSTSAMALAGYFDVAFDPAPVVRFRQAAQTASDDVFGGFQQVFDVAPVNNFFSTLNTWSAEGFEGVKTASEKTKDEVTNNLFDMASAADIFATGLENGLVNAAAQGKSAFGDMAQFILAELQRMLIRAMLFQAFTGLGGAIGGQFGGKVEAFGQRFGNAPVSGGRAAGGPVMGGRSYMVGERGPEIVTMGANGFVTPNHKLGGPTFNVDMRGASLEAVQRLEQIVMQVNGSIEQRSVAAVQDRFSRAPSYMRR